MSVLQNIIAAVFSCVIVGVAGSLALHEVRVYRAQREGASPRRLIRRMTGAVGCIALGILIEIGTAAKYLLTPKGYLAIWGTVGALLCFLVVLAVWDFVIVLVNYQHRQKKLDKLFRAELERAAVRYQEEVARHKRNGGRTPHPNGEE